MKKAFSCLVLLLGLVQFQRVEAQDPKPEPPQGTTAQPKPAVEDPLGRSTPHGTVVGLVTAAEQQNLERAAEYLPSGLKVSDRRELARQLWVVLDRKLLTSLERVSSKPDGDLDDGLTNSDRIGVVDSPSGDVEMLVDRVPRGQDSAIWLFSASTVQQIPRLYAEVGPPSIERYVPGRLRTIRWLSMPLYRWIAILLFVPLVFGLAALSTSALTGLLNPVFRRFTRGQRPPPARQCRAASPADSGPVVLRRIARRLQPRRPAVLALCGGDGDGRGAGLALVAPRRPGRGVEPLPASTSPSIGRHGPGAPDQPSLEGRDGDGDGPGAAVSLRCRSDGRAHRPGRWRPGDWLRRPEND